MAKPKQPIDDFVPAERLVDERGPTTEWGRRNAFTVSDTGTITALQSPISRAVARGTLTHRQGRAADKFYFHWSSAGLRGTTGSADLNKIFGTGVDPSRLCSTEKAVAHYEAFARAVSEVKERADSNGSRSDHAARVLILIVCEEWTFSDAGQKIGFSAKAAETMARTILKSALNVLIKRWNL